MYMPDIYIYIYIYIYIIYYIGLFTTINILNYLVLINDIIINIIIL